MNTFLEYVVYFVMLVCTGIVLWYAFDKLMDAAFKRTFKEEPTEKETTAGGKPTLSNPVTDLLSLTNVSISSILVSNFELIPRYTQVILSSNEGLYRVKLGSFMLDTNTRVDFHNLPVEAIGFNFTGDEKILLLRGKGTRGWWRLRGSFISFEKV